MFDTITWADDLPYSTEMEELGLNLRGSEFQTKDLEALMDHYVIQDKKLFLRKYKIDQWVEGNPDATSLHERLGYLDRREPYFEETKVTATLRIYDFLYSVRDRWDCWVEYQVVVKDGVVDTVSLIEFKKESDSERKKTERRHAETLAYEQSLLINRLFFHTKIYYVPAMFLRRKLYSLSNLIIRLANKL